jgi:hypothetical protein
VAVVAVPERVICVALARPVQRSPMAMRGGRGEVASSDSCVVSCPIADFGSDVYEEGANRLPG